MRVRHVSFDAAGTLIGLKASIGSIYFRQGRKLGFLTGTEGSVVPELNRAFVNSFRSHKPMAFPGAEPGEIPKLEYRWWKTVTRETLDAVEVSDFDAFFDHLWNHFRSGEVWRLEPHCRAVLQKLASIGLEVSVISNFDSRLTDILTTLGIAEFFSAIVVSSRAGAAKPDPVIFRMAEAQTSAACAEWIHVGDSLSDDVEGAAQAGIRAVLYDAGGKHPGGASSKMAFSVRSLAELPEILL